jgi:hypothetical protein
MTEPIKTDKTNEPGRPSISETQYMDWLLLMQPFLRAGNTIWYSMERCDLLGHAKAIYQKYRSKDWFSQKIDSLRRTPGELVNNIFYNEVNRINAKMIAGGALTREEIDVLKFMGEKHRTAQPFFVSRVENAEANPEEVGKVLDTMEGQTDYADIGREATKQVVEVNAPVQDQNKSGGSGNVPTQQPATPAPSGEGGTQV